GQISEAYANAAQEHGAELLLGWKVTALRQPASAHEPWTVGIQRGDEVRTITGDHVWSTIPISILARISDPPPPAEVLDAAAAIDYRAMILVYLELDVDRFTEYDAHY